ncbi:MAG TPA: single-stranded DNA-binding protein [Terriglobia bacterium]|nr:single-stranded DNA-binding protein [Terriglobia bacterium]
MSVNRVILLGFAGKDSEMKYTSSGTALCRFSLATNERFKNKAGEIEEHTEWHSIVAWGKLAEICSEYVTRGKLCYVEGKIRSRKWQDKQGNERKSFEIVASQMRLLSSSNGNAAKSKTESAKLAPQSLTSQRVSQPSEADNPFEAADSDGPF